MKIIHTTCDETVCKQSNSEQLIFLNKHPILVEQRSNLNCCRFLFFHQILFILTKMKCFYSSLANTHTKCVPILNLPMHVIYCQLSFVVVVVVAYELRLQAKLSNKTPITSSKCFESNICIIKVWQRQSLRIENEKNATTKLYSVESTHTIEHAKF